MTSPRHDDTLEMAVTLLPVPAGGATNETGDDGTTPPASAPHANWRQRIRHPGIAGQGRSLSTVLTTAGVVLSVITMLLLSFAAYGIVVTGWVQHRDQSHLQASLGKVITLAKAGGETSGGFFGRHGAAKIVPPRSTAVALLVIPRLHLTQAVLSGVTPAHLAEGPALYRGSAAVGGTGNTDIAGHRTLDGAPFYHLDRLVRGDTIILTTAKGRFTYTVEATEVVKPGQRSALRSFGDKRLTLTTGDPVFEEAHPLVVESLLTASTLWSGASPPAAAAVPGRDQLNPEVPGSDGEWIIILVGLAVAIGASVTPLALRRRWPDRTDIRASWIVAGPVMLAAIFLAFRALTDVLPATI